MPLDKKIEDFMAYVSSLSLESKMIMHPAKQAQIALLLNEKITMPAEYLDFANVFLKDLPKVLPKQTKISKYAIQLVNNI